ncbi:hypothetical protein ACFOM8_16200 [Paracoccus angustae]|uniref:Uncharacterized protein n=1 Tax=Paracoccus angustae TaxID=1671480 RepID=A0ABV7U7Y5_9RHOB
MTLAARTLAARTLAAGTLPLGKPGPRILLRCEPDGLPIEDLADVPHRSAVAGRGHQCGHDGDERADLRRNPGPDRDKAVQPLNDAG